MNFTRMILAAGIAAMTISGAMAQTRDQILIVGSSTVFPYTQAVAVDGVLPSVETIADGSYAVSRPLYIYIKNAHKGVISGLADFVNEYVSEASIGDGGYLSERGLIALPLVDREATRLAVENNIPVTSN